MLRFKVLSFKVYALGLGFRFTVLRLRVLMFKV